MLLHVLGELEYYLHVSHFMSNNKSTGQSFIFV